MQNQESVWDPSGFINKHIVISNVTLRSSTRKQNVCPDIQTNCVYVNKPYGFWEGNECFKNFQLLAEKLNVIKPKSFNTLLVFGDSLGVRFFGSLSLKPIFTTLFQKCQNIYSWTYVSYKYFTEEQEMHIKDNKDFNDTLFFRGIYDLIMLDNDTQSNKSVAVFNFGLHLLKSLSLKKTMELFDGFLKVLRDIRKTLDMEDYNCPCCPYGGEELSLYESQGKSTTKKAFQTCISKFNSKSLKRLSVKY